MDDIAPLIRFAQEPLRGLLTKGLVRTNSQFTAPSRDLAFLALPAIEQAKELERRLRPHVPNWQIAGELFSWRRWFAGCNWTIQSESQFLPRERARPNSKFQSLWARKAFLLVDAEDFIRPPQGRHALGFRLRPGTRDIVRASAEWVVSWFTPFDNVLLKLHKEAIASRRHMDLPVVRFMNEVAGVNEDTLHVDPGEALVFTSAMMAEHYDSDPERFLESLSSDIRDFVPPGLFPSKEGEALHTLVGALHKRARRPTDEIKSDVYVGITTEAATQAEILRGNNAVSGLGKIAEIDGQLAGTFIGGPVHRRLDDEVRNQRLHDEATAEAFHTLNQCESAPADPSGALARSTRAVRRQRIVAKLVRAFRGEIADKPVADPKVAIVDRETTRRLARAIREFRKMYRSDRAAFAALHCRLRDTTLREAAARFGTTPKRIRRWTDFPSPEDEPRLIAELRRLAKSVS